ncbi:tetratricopeptide repeat protein [Rufibacter sediminis]|uniref:Tetratricopeptide repeat protein n=1 Tax=Rufibacter sediminis TaxID=2762756 RepID=A0ABR6VMV8_9BACT|nr:tetratricopeptide repeat protein [Rufibacter sediminis]MBC3538517.1 tetratricopeptide repeat protein [Rufibacter sediminis]
MKKVLFFVLFLISFLQAQAQVPDSTKQIDQKLLDSLQASIILDSVDVLPQALDIKGWLLLNESIMNELGGAVDNMYNFKFETAEKQFKSLRRRYPKHPMPYFLIGLSQWWKMVPSNITDTRYDNYFLAYIDTTITLAENLYEKDNKNLEAAFFLSAANGFGARLHAERKNWRKAAIMSNRALDYLQKSKKANGLSDEFLFGEALFNYYAVWIHEHYPLLRPILYFFPKGNKNLGLKQLQQVAFNGFYTGTEAKFFLMKIYANDAKNGASAMSLAQYLASTYPDNPYFQRFYARMAFTEGNFAVAEQLSTQILDKINRKVFGYEAISGRYASFYLGYIHQYRNRDYAKARSYYQQCISFAEQINEQESGYYISSFVNLARICDKEKNVRQAKQYYEVVLKLADSKSDAEKEAKAYLKKNRKVK